MHRSFGILKKFFRVLIGRRKKEETDLTNVNNYLRTASYRKNYQKYRNGIHKGKYIDLDFSYLQELSTTDMHFRFIVSKMCLDIEHDLKVKMLKDIKIRKCREPLKIKDFRHF